MHVLRPIFGTFKMCIGQNTRKIAILTCIHLVVQVGDLMIFIILIIDLDRYIEVTGTVTYR